MRKWPQARTTVSFMQDEYCSCVLCLMYTLPCIKDPEITACFMYVWCTMLHINACVVTTRGPTSGWDGNTLFNKHFTCFSPVPVYVHVHWHLQCGITRATAHRLATTESQILQKVLCASSCQPENAWPHISMNSLLFKQKSNLPLFTK